MSAIERFHCIYLKNCALKIAPTFTVSNGWLTNTPAQPAIYIKFKTLKRIKKNKMKIWIKRAYHKKVVIVVVMISKHWMIWTSFGREDIINVFD